MIDLKKQQLFKFIWTIVVVFIGLISCKSYGQNEKQTTTEKDTVNVVSFMQLDHVPEFENLPEFKNNKEARDYFQKGMQEFIGDHINMDTLQAYATEEVTKIITQFTIDAEGKVINISVEADSEGLKDEGLRLLNQLPDFKPGIKEGKPVPVKYTFPIIYKQDLPEKTEEE